MALARSIREATAHSRPEVRCVANAPSGIAIDPQTCSKCRPPRGAAETRCDAPLDSGFRRIAGVVPCASSRRAQARHTAHAGACQLLAEGHFTAPGRFLIDPIHTGVIVVRQDGKLKTIAYWCDVCNIRGYTPGPCRRCQKETLLDLRDPGARYAPPRRDSGSSPLRSPGQPPKLE